MALYVVVTDKCQADADRHGQGSLVASLRQSVECTQNLTGFAFFLPSPFLKKSLGRSFRLIAFRAPVADDELIFFLRVLARGSKDYEGFLAKWDKDTDGVTSQFLPYDETEIKRIHVRLTNVPPPRPLPAPDAEEREWLYEVFREEKPDEELLVLETGRLGEEDARAGEQGLLGFVPPDARTDGY